VVAPAAIITGGEIDIDYRFYLSDENNTRKQDITDYIFEGSIDADTTSEGCMMVFRGTCIKRDLLTPFRDWIVPILVLTYPDPRDGNSNIVVERQMGLYNVMPSPRISWTQYGPAIEIDARDALYRLTSNGPGVPYNIAKGTNVATKMQSICNAVGINAQIQPSTKTLPGKRSFTSEQKWIEIINALGRSIGYVPIYPSRKSKWVQSRGFRKLGDSHHAFTLTTADGAIADDITTEVDLTRLTNKVTVVGNNLKGEPISVVIVNNDPSSPTSTVRLGTVTDPYVLSYYEENSNIIGQADVRARAEYLMDQGSSVMERMNLRCPPIYDWEINDVIKCDLADELGNQIASGIWRWERFRMDFTLEGDYEWTMYKLIKWSQVDG